MSQNCLSWLLRYNSCTMGVILVPGMHWWRGTLETLSTAPRLVIEKSMSFALARYSLPASGTSGCWSPPMGSMVTNGISYSMFSIITGWSWLWTMSRMESRECVLPMGPWISMTPVGGWTNSSFCWPYTWRRTPPPTQGTSSLSQLTSNCVRGCSLGVIGGLRPLVLGWVPLSLGVGGFESMEVLGIAWARPPEQSSWLPFDRLYPHTLCRFWPIAPPAL